MRIQGWDISLNHGAIVELDYESAKTTRLWFMTNNAKYQKMFPGVSFLIPKNINIQSTQVKNIIRRQRWREIFNIIFKQGDLPEHVAVEDYSYGSSKKSHQIGELGAHIRDTLFEHKIPFRLYDIMHIKLFAARKGNAKKDEMIKGCLDRWDKSFKEFRNPNSKKQEVEEDLCDAYTIAQLLRTELQLRHGEITLEQLPVQDIQVFNCVTKANKTNILARDFITNV